MPRKHAKVQFRDADGRWWEVFCYETTRRRLRKMLRAAHAEWEDLPGSPLCFGWWFGFRYAGAAVREVERP